MAAPSASAHVPRVGIRKEHVVILGRYLFVFRPVIDSILDTIFWGDGYKSIAHIVLLSYLSYHHLCGIRFMFLFTVFHFFMKAGKRWECSEEEAVFHFKATVEDLTIALRRFQPSLRHVWPALVVVTALGLLVELVLHHSIVEWIDASIGPLTVVVICICYGLVDPRYTRNYTIATSSGVHSRTNSNASPGGNGSTVRRGNGDAPSLSASVPRTLHEPDTPTVSAPAVLSPLTLTPKHEAYASPTDGAGSTRSSGTEKCAYSPGDTPSGPWDELMPPCPTIPLFVHKVLMLYTKAPDWVDWKVSDQFVARNHPIAWTVVKAGLNVAIIPKVSFDDAVRFIDDDPDFRTPVEALNVFRFDKLLGEFRRLCIVDEHTKVIHMVYKQIMFGIAPRDAPMYQFAKELTKEEIEYYGLCRPHANNKNVTNGEGRVFVLSSAPAEGVPPVKGHVRCIVHRQAIVIREVLPENCIEMMTMVCGEPGGSVPARIVDMTRGEQLKVVVAMRKAFLESVARSKKKNQ